MTLQASAARAAETAGDTGKYVTFRVDDHSYGVAITQVREIRQWSATTPLPNQPRYTKGVLNLRGMIVPVHDLRVRLGGSTVEPTAANVVVIAQIGAKTVGVLVDAVSDILEAQDSDIREVPSVGTAGAERAVCGLLAVGAEMVALLDFGQLFADPAGDPG